MTVPSFGHVYLPCSKAKSWQFSAVPVGNPRYLAVLSYSQSFSKKGISWSTILPLCRAPSWLTRAELAFGLEDVEQQLVLKGWAVIPKYICYQLPSRHPRRIS